MPSVNELVVVYEQVSELIVNTRLWDAVADVESVTWIVKGNTPKMLGVPPITPAVEIVSPVGSAPDVRDHV